MQFLYERFIHFTPILSAITLSFECSKSLISIVMPLIMDDGLDDLFGDAPPMQLPDPLPKGLFQRVDELSLSGCCQYVASFQVPGPISLNAWQKAGLVKAWLHCLRHF